jgi:hypothetical protein
MNNGITAVKRLLAWPGETRRIVGVAGLGVALLAALFLGLIIQRDTVSLQLPAPPAAVALQSNVEVSVSPGTDIPADSKPLPWRASGRWLPTPDGHGLLHEWPGLTVSARFEGRTVLLTLDDASNRFRLSVDGTPMALLTRPGNATIRVSGLDDGPHDLHLERLSEAWAPARINGLFVPPSGDVLTPDPLPAHRIDVFGDSDSVGYGNTSTSRLCPGDNVFLLTDATQAWPRILANHYKTTASVMARSGIGLVRNGTGGMPDTTMSQIHNRLLPSDATTATVTARQAKPWLTVVALGDNDFSQPLALDEFWPNNTALQTSFTRTLDHFLRTRLRDFPGSPILLLSFTEVGQDAHPGLSAVSKQLAAEGQPVLNIKLPRLDRQACDWHPSLADHRLISDTLISTIDDLILKSRLPRP